MRSERKLPLPVARLVSEALPRRTREMWVVIEAKRRKRLTRRWLGRGVAVMVAGFALGLLVLPRPPTPTCRRCQAGV